MMALGGALCACEDVLARGSRKRHGSLSSGHFTKSMTSGYAVADLEQAATGYHPDPIVQRCDTARCAAEIKASRVFGFAIET
tara:strand:+ start:9631 stop:9876 length:246 start_codon:yes stop_codon:yes gene_type:complete